MPGAKLDDISMARRAAQEIRAGEAVAIGSGLPAAIPTALPPWQRSMVPVRERGPWDSPTERVRKDTPEARE